MSALFSIKLTPRPGMGCEIPRLRNSVSSELELNIIPDKNGHTKGVAKSIENKGKVKSMAKIISEGGRLNELSETQVKSGKDIDCKLSIHNVNRTKECHLVGKSLSDTLRRSAVKPKCNSPKPGSKLAKIKSPASNKSPAKNIRAQTSIKSFLCHKGKSSPKITPKLSRIKETAKKFEQIEKSKEDTTRNKLENKFKPITGNKIGMIVNMFEMESTINVTHAPLGTQNPNNLAKVKSDSKENVEKKSEVSNAFNILMASRGGKTPKLKRLRKSSAKN